MAELYQKEKYLFLCTYSSCISDSRIPVAWKKF